MQTTIRTLNAYVILSHSEENLDLDNQLTYL